MAVTVAALSLIRPNQLGEDDSHSPFTAAAFALLRSQSGALLVGGAEILQRAFGGHAVKLAHHQLVQVVRVRQPRHQQIQH